MSNLEELMGQQVNVQDGVFSLSDLANIDLSEVDEVRGSSFPAGVFIWEVVADPVPGFDVIDVKNKDTGVDEKRAVLKFAFKCIEVVSMPPKQKDGSASPSPESVLGKMFTESFFIKAPEDFGRVRAFLTDIGVDTTQKKAVQQYCLDAVGSRFQAPIVQRFKKDDHDVIYTNLDRTKIKAIAG